MMRFTRTATALLVALLIACSSGSPSETKGNGPATRVPKAEPGALQLQRLTHVRPVVRPELRAYPDSVAPMIWVSGDEVLYGGMPTDIGMLGVRLEAAVQRNQRDGRPADVLVQIDENCPWQQVVAVADAIASAGVDHLVFVFDHGADVGPSMFQAAAIPVRLGPGGTRLALPSATPWREASKRITPDRSALALAVDG